MSIKKRFGLAGLLAVLTCHSAAADLPPIAFLSMGFKEVRLKDVESTPEHKTRLAAPGGFLGVTADFNGDGKPDEARILQNRERQIAYVVAVISSPTKVDTYVQSQIALSEVAHTGVRAVKPRSDLTSGEMRTGLAIFDLRTGAGEANFFDGEEFYIRLPFETSVKTST
ncbi:MAG: hypothetical protein LH465_01855 [Sphingomonas bacterium]|nr:hypothetical protein [Sphingomonas bacterium]